MKRIIILIFFSFISIITSHFLQSEEQNKYYTKMICFDDRYDGMGPTVLLTPFKIHPKDNEEVDKRLLSFIYKTIICDTLIINFLEQFIKDYEIQNEISNRSGYNFSIYIVHYHYGNSNILSFHDPKTIKIFFQKMMKIFDENNVNCPKELREWINYYINKKR